MTSNQSLTQNSTTCRRVYGGTDSNTLSESVLPSNSSPTIREEKICCQKFGTLFNSIKLEILIFISTSSLAVSKVSSASMILDKSCLAYYGYPEDICGNLQNYTVIKSAVEKVSANYQMAYLLMRTIPSVVISLFIGPWSDKYGRMMPMKIMMVGAVLEYSISAVCSHFLNSPIEYYLIAALIGGLSGGSASLSTIMYSLVADLTTSERRTVKYAFFEVAMGLSMALSIASGGLIYMTLGYTTVFIVAMSGFCFSLVWLIFIPETKGQDSKDSWKVKLKNLFSFQTVLEGFKAATKKRPINGRKQILLIITSLCILHTVQSGTLDITFLYVHHQFDWNNTTFSYIYAFYYFLSTVLLVLAVPVLKHFNVSDFIIALIGTATMIAKQLTIGLAWKTSIYHIACVLGLPSAWSVMAFRSRLSKIVSKEDLGKMFAFVSIAEHVVPLIATVIFSQLFNAFLDIYPGTPYFFTVLIAVLPFAVAIWIKFLPDLVYGDIEGKNQSKPEVTSASDN